MHLGRRYSVPLLDGMSYFCIAGTLVYIVVPLLIFSLGDLSIAESVILKPSTITVLLLISPFNALNVCLVG